VIGFSVLFNATLSGLSVDTALVKLPTRWRIGVLAYATFARGNDLGNGVRVYPVWAILSALLVAVPTILAVTRGLSSSLTLVLAIASVATVGHFVVTGRAAPVMLSLRNTADDERLLTARLNAFARWHAARTVLQLLASVTLIAALVLSR